MSGLKWDIENLHSYVNNILRMELDDKPFDSDWSRGYREGRIAVLTNMREILQNHFPLEEESNANLRSNTRGEADRPPSRPTQSGEDAASGELSRSVLPVNGQSSDAVTDVPTVREEGDPI